MTIEILNNKAGKGFHGLEASTYFKDEEGHYFKALTMKRYGGKVVTTIEEVKTDGEEKKWIEGSSHGEHYHYIAHHNIKRLTKKALLDAHQASLNKFLEEYK